MGTAGYFVDWNGDTRRVDRPGDGLTCQILNKMCEGQPYQGVNVIDTAGFVIHEAMYFQSLSGLEKAGVVVNLVD